MLHRNQGAVPYNRVIPRQQQVAVRQSAGKRAGRDTNGTSEHGFGMADQVDSAMADPNDRTLAARSGNGEVAGCQVLDRDRTARCLDLRTLNVARGADKGDRDGPAASAYPCVRDDIRRAGNDIGPAAAAATDAGATTAASVAAATAAAT